MRNVKYGVVILALLATVPLLGMARGGSQSTQPQPSAVEPELQKLADDYTAAWAKGDAAAIAALFITDAMYIDSQANMMSGRSEIESGFRQRFAGTFKGTTITITVGQSRQVAPDVRIGEGTWQITGLTTAATGATTGVQPAAATAGQPTTAGSSLKGRYLNTMVRQQGRWVIASTAAVPEMPPTR